MAGLLDDLLFRQHGAIASGGLLGNLPAWQAQMRGPGDPWAGFDNIPPEAYQAAFGIYPKPFRRAAPAGQEAPLPYLNMVGVPSSLPPDAVTPQAAPAPAQGAGQAPPLPSPVEIPPAPVAAQMDQLPSDVSASRTPRAAAPAVQQDHPIGMPMPQGSGPSGGGLFSGINGNLLLALGAGLASGSDLGQGVGNALQLAMASRASDQKQAQAQQTQLATYQALRSRGMSHGDATAAVLNPEIMKTAAAQIFGEKKAPDTKEVDGRLYQWDGKAWKLAVDPYATTAGAPAAGAPATARPTDSAETIRPVPPGADPKEWRKSETERLAKLQAGKPAAQASAAIVVQDINRVLNKISGESFFNPVTGMTGSAAAKISGTDAHDVANLLNTVKANAGFDKLQALRQASPTGGALGAVSDKENMMLQSAIGALEQSQSKAQLKQNLERVRETYLDIIHGPGNRPQQAAASDPARMQGLKQKYGLD